MNARGQKILLVEDDPSIALGLKMNLEAEGYAVASAADGREGLEKARGNGFDLVVLDLMLPHVNGFEFLKTLKSEGRLTPTLILSARGSEMDKVTGLELGAEDYLTKPFGLAELLARVRKILGRRAREQAEPAWRLGPFEVDPSSRQVRRGGKAVELTRAEFDVLSILRRSKERVLSRRAILDALWGPGYHASERTVDNFIAQLRAKLEEDPARPERLVTVRGVGYRLVLGDAPKGRGR